MFLPLGGPGSRTSQQPEAGPAPRRWFNMPLSIKGSARSLKTGLILGPEQGNYNIDLKVLETPKWLQSRLTYGCFSSTVEASTLWSLRATQTEDLRKRELSFAKYGLSSHWGGSQQGDWGEKNLWNRTRSQASQSRTWCLWLLGVNLFCVCFSPRKTVPLNRFCLKLLTFGSPFLWDISGDFFLRRGNTVIIWFVIIWHY